ncbi:MAG: ABC transporter permease [Treponema sp.]|nr:ABC transporter permease [Spirochaetia bacterium]MDD6294990.1 ABC transporter permease [Treponema sp.]MDD7451630.1 ABC transporter permease [Treponema sp.]MDY2924308.1 ABC transporter permease [Treponema sp.]MDY5683103.1 ABC transporter permease [Treponema sp.]
MINKIKDSLKKLLQSQLAIPIIALTVLVLFNLIRDPAFFSIAIKKNNFGNTVLSGNLISILNGASELAILAVGMTLITSATKGQDISIGAAAAIAGSVFVKILRANTINVPVILAAIIFACFVATLFCLFNGLLIAKFNIQPMIASLILYTAGRPIAYWINGGATPNVESPLLKYIGGFIPHIAVPTPILIVITFIILINLLLKKTTLGLYIQAVGINERAAKLNGINPVFMKMIVFVILGICVTLAGSMNVCRIGLINHETILLDIEMDAILAVAIGGNSLGGGKFKLSGSILGAYIIQALTTTLYAMKVPSTSVRAYKAVVIITIVILGSPVVKSWFKQIKNKLSQNANSAVKAEAK